MAHGLTDVYPQIAYLCLPLKHGYWVPVGDHVEFFVEISGYPYPRNVVSGRGIIENGLSDQFQRGLGLRSEATRGRMNDAGVLRMVLWISRKRDTLHLSASHQRRKLADMTPLPAGSPAFCSLPNAQGDGEKSVMGLIWVMRHVHEAPCTYELMGENKSLGPVGLFLSQLSFLPLPSSPSS